MLRLDEDRHQAARAAFERAAARSGRLHWVEADGDPFDSLTRRARYADLILLGQPDPNGPHAADQPTAPAYFTYDAQLNSRERATLQETLARELQPMTLDQLLAAQAAGAQVLDTREAAQFASGHLVDSINIGLVGQYATWAGTILDREKPIAIIADPGQE